MLGIKELGSQIKYSGPRMRVQEDEREGRQEESHVETRERGPRPPRRPHVGARKGAWGLRVERGSTSGQPASLGR